MALPYSVQWVGIASASPPASERWHLYWKGEPSVLCGVHVEGDSDIGSVMTGKDMASSLTHTQKWAAWTHQCGVCATQFRKIVYWKIEHGEYLEDMRA